MKHTRHIQHVTGSVYSSCCPVLPPSSLAGPSVASVYISMQSRYHIDISADIALIPHERFFSGPLCPFYFYFFFTLQQEQPAVRFLLPLTDKLHRHPSPLFVFFCPTVFGTHQLCMAQSTKCCHPRAWCVWVHIQRNC